MSELIKVEVTIVNGDWQWLGKLSKEHLKVLCALADQLSDIDVEAKLKARQ